MRDFTSTTIPGGQTMPVQLSPLLSGNSNGILIINSSGFIAHIGDSNKVVLFNIPAGQGLSVPYRAGSNLFAWTDATVSNPGFGLMGDIRVTLTSDELKLSGGILVDAYAIPVSAVTSYNGRSGAVAGVQSDVINALGYTPADIGNTVYTFNGRKQAVTLTGPDVTSALSYTPANAANVVSSFNARVGPVTLLTADVRAVYSRYTIPPVLIVATASPFVYQNTGTSDMSVYITSGTFTLVEFSRDNVNFYPITPSLDLGPGDRLRLTYTVAPNILGVPL